MNPEAELEELRQAALSYMEELCSHWRSESMAKLMTPAEQILRRCLLASEEGEGSGE